MTSAMKLKPLDSITLEHTDFRYSDDLLNLSLILDIKNPCSTLFTNFDRKKVDKCNENYITALNVLENCNFGLNKSQNYQDTPRLTYRIPITNLNTLTVNENESLIINQHSHKVLWDLKQQPQALDQLIEKVDILHINKPRTPNERLLTQVYTKIFSEWIFLLKTLNNMLFDRQLPNELNRLAKQQIWPESLEDEITVESCYKNKTGVNTEIMINFTVPIINRDVSISEVIPFDHYVRIENNLCWYHYVGPHLVLTDKSNGCVKDLQMKTVRSSIIKSTSCQDGDQISYEDHWMVKECVEKPSAHYSKLQVKMLTRGTGIYCFPFDIVIDGKQQKCPTFPFILNENVKFKFREFIKGIERQNEQTDAVDQSTNLNLHEIITRENNDSLSASEPKETKTDRLPRASRIAVIVVLCSVTSLLVGLQLVKLLPAAWIRENLYHFYFTTSITPSGGRVPR